MVDRCQYGCAPFEFTLSIIGGKWKMKILYELSCHEILRYGELKRRIRNVTHKMLSAQLSKLENDGIIIRREYLQALPKVEYSLTLKGESLVPIINEMCNWGVKYQS